MPLIQPSTTTRALLTLCFTCLASTLHICLYAQFAPFPAGYVHTFTLEGRTLSIDGTEFLSVILPDSSQPPHIRTSTHIYQGGVWTLSLDPQWRFLSPLALHLRFWGRIPVRNEEGQFLGWAHARELYTEWRFALDTSGIFRLYLTPFLWWVGIASQSATGFATHAQIQFWGLAHKNWWLALNIRNVGWTIIRLSSKTPRALPIHLSISAFHRFRHAPFGIVLTYQGLESWQRPIDLPPLPDTPSLLDQAKYWASLSMAHLTIGTIIYLSPNIEVLASYNWYIRRYMVGTLYRGLAGLAWAIRIHTHHWTWTMGMRFTAPQKPILALAIHAPIPTRKRQPTNPNP